MKKPAAKLPTVIATIVGPRARPLFRVRCPFCHQVHFHAAREGERAPHCAMSRDPVFRARRYVLQLEGRTDA